MRVHTQGVGRSRRQITWPEWYDMCRTLPHSQPIGLVQSAYVTSLLRGDCTKLVQHQHRVLYERQNAAASLGMHMYGFRIVLKDTFAPGDLDTVINQLVFRGHGDLEQFVDDRIFFFQSGRGNHGRVQYAATNRGGHDRRCRKQVDSHLLGERACWTGRQRSVEGP